MSIQNEESTRSLSSQENKDFTHAQYDPYGIHLTATQRSQHKTTTVSTDMSDSSLSRANFSSNTVNVNLPVLAQQGEVERPEEERRQEPESQRDDLDWVDISKKLAQPEYEKLESPMFALYNEMSKFDSGPVWDNFDILNPSHFEISNGSCERMENDYIPAFTDSKDFNRLRMPTTDYSDRLYDALEHQFSFGAVDCPPLYLPQQNSEADYLFSDELVKKRKFRLMINAEMESQLKAEFPNHSDDLREMVVLKYRTLNLYVEVKAYRRQDKNVDKATDLKAFNIIFNSYRDAKTALDMTKKGELDFIMKEARPSPNYYVKYIVMYEVCVWLGKCFSKLVCQLEKGDIVTANQLKGNKLRIIRCRPLGSSVEHDLNGWVLLQTKEKELLRRVDYIDGEIVMTENRPNFETLIPKEHQIIQPIKSNVQRTNPQRVSAARCSPFRVLTQVEVCKGRKEPTVVDTLMPNTVVWANQHKGSMLRIVKMDSEGRIKLDGERKPEAWGWVSLRKKGEDKPRLERISNTRFSMKIKKKSICSAEVLDCLHPSHCVSDNSSLNLTSATTGGSISEPSKSDSSVQPCEWTMKESALSTVSQDPMRLIMAETGSPSSGSTMSIS